MLKVVVLVSGGGTNLQAIIDGVKGGVIRNTKIVGVISNNKNAYALERARENHIPAKCISPKDYESRDVFNEKLLEAVNEYEPDLIVLAGFWDLIKRIILLLSEREIWDRRSQIMLLLRGAALF